MQERFVLRDVRGVVGSARGPVLDYMLVVMCLLDNEQAIIHGSNAEMEPGDNANRSFLQSAAVRRNHALLDALDTDS